MINRCANCGSWYDLRRFSACPICGNTVGTATTGVPMAQMPPSYRVEREAASDRELALWTIPVGILVGLAGPLLLYRAIGHVTVGAIAGFVVMLVVAIVFGASASARDEPARFAAGRVARTALLTLAIVLALAAVMAVVVFVLAFVACASGKGKIF